MRIYTRYKAARKRWSWRGTFRLLLAFAGLAIVGYVVFRSAGPDAPPTGLPAKPARPRATPARSAPGTNLSRVPLAGTSRIARAISPSGGTTNLTARPSPAPGLPAAVPGPATNLVPVVPTPFRPQSASTLLEAQIALARLGFSCGAIDGANGYQTRAALRAFQQRSGLPPSGALDAATRRQLALDAPPFTAYVVTSNDLARLSPIPSTWLGKSQQSRLDYVSLLELVAEQHRAHPALLRRLNPEVDWPSVKTGRVLTVPHVPAPMVPARLAFVRIRLQDRMLSGYGLRTNLLLQFPCSIGARVEKRPVGRLEVVVVAKDPAYTFNPQVFPESAEGRRLKRKLTIPPGPNNPVGVAWIGLNRPGYGIHGTPRPEDVGRTESHGCFRLANWDAALLAELVWRGLPVYVQN